MRQKLRKRKKEIKVAKEAYASLLREVKILIKKDDLSLEVKTAILEAF